LVTSSDGVTWTARTTPSSTTYNAAAYGASTYVAVAATSTSSGGFITSSSDGITWTTTKTETIPLNDCIFANGLFVVVGGDGNGSSGSGACFTSSNGTSWTQRGTSSLVGWSRVIYENGLYVVVGRAGRINTSPDGITWTNRTSNLSANLNDIAWNGSVYCVVGASGQIATSPDGVTWTARTPGDTTVTLLSISWNGTRFIVTNSTNGVAWTSTDGITWSRVSTAYRGTTLYSAYLGGKFVAIGNSFVQSSTDGLTWKSGDPVAYVVSTVNKIYKLGSYYYACTGSGLFQSSDGIAFAPVRETPPSPILSMAYSGSAWLAVSSAAAGQSQAFYKSTNGTTWSKASDFGTLTSTSTISGVAADIVYANGNFISGQTITTAQNIFQGIYTSSDGVTWTGRSLPANISAATTLASSGTNAYANGILGGSNMILKSTDGGVTWNTLAQGSNPVYVGGYLISANTFVTQDDSVFLPNPIATITNLYVYQNYLISTGLNLTTKSIVNLKNGSGQTSIVNVVNSLSKANITTASPSKELVIRGTVGLIPGIGTSNNFNIYLIGELNLYSYDTSTTFWVPHAGGQIGQTSYIYAGA
jgi:hypothetical protein